MDEKYIDKEEQFYNDVINGVIELVDIPEGEIHISEEEAIRLQNIGISIHSNEYLLAEFQAIQEALLEAVSCTHLTLPTIQRSCRSRWSPYH